MKTIQLNQEVLQNLYGDSEESKSEVFLEFLSTYSDLKKNLFTAYEEGSLDSMKSLLHYHGPSFMYLGVPDVADAFKKLEQRCSTIRDHHSVSAEFFNLLQMVDDTWLQVYNYTMYYKKESHAA
jgi:hypothetical protein